MKIQVSLLRENCETLKLFFLIIHCLIINEKNVIISNLITHGVELVPPLKSRYFIITTHFVRQKKFVDRLCSIVPATSHRDIEIDF